MKKKTLLLVDDNETSLKLLSAVFDGDYTLFTAGDGLEALEVLFQQHVDLVISDILMPNMDGYNLLYKIRTNPRLKDIPVIVYTATYVSLSEEKIAKEMGANKYLRKPAPPKVLAATVEGMLAEPEKYPHIVPNRPEASERLSQYSVKLIAKLEQNNAELEEANARLAASERQFRNTLENMMEGVQIIDFNWRYIYVNDALTQYSYHPKETLLKHSILELYPGVENTTLFKVLKQCRDERTAHHIENDFTFPDGTTRYFELSIQPIPEGIFILSIDITDRKRAEEKLLKANRLYAFISAINQSIVHIKDEQELLDRACHIATEIGQYKMAWMGKLDENGGLNFVSVQGEEAAVHVWSTYSGIDYSSPQLRVTPAGRALSTGECALSNDAQHDPDTSVWKEQLERFGIKGIVALPIKKFGHTIGVFGLISGNVNQFDDAEIALLKEAAGDISFALEVFEKEELRQKAESEIEALNEQLSATNHQLSTILNTLPANIALLDSNATIIAVNEAWKNFAIDNNMRSSTQGVGDNYIDVCEKAIGASEEDGRKMASGLSRILKGELTEFAMEYPCHMPSKRRWFRVEVRPLTGKKDSGAVVMHINITEEKEAEDKILELNQSLEMKVAQRTAQLQEINNDLESFNYSVSHDLRSPLQVISGYSSILSKKYEATLSAEAQGLLTGIKTYTRQMSLIMESLLNLSRLGRASIAKESCNMNEVVKAVVAEQKMLHKGRNLDIKVHDLPDALCDAALVKQVWVNLISNAIKYSRQKEQPSVEIGAMKVGPEKAYFVKDNGAGFDMQHADRLFQAFQRLHATSEFEGVGIGLTIVNRIVTKHGGRVWAEAAEGEGATFCFTLSPIRKRTQAAV